MDKEYKLGSEAEMAKLVNDKAQENSMANSKFINITGLDDSNNYSSAEDLLIFLKQALKNDKFREIFTNKKYDYIFFDAYMGHDIVPAIYEYSTIQRLKSILNENGYLGINYVIPNQDMYNKLMDVLTHNFDYIKEYGYIIKEKFYPRVDYLEIIDKLEV